MVLGVAIRSYSTRCRSRLITTYIKNKLAYIKLSSHGNFFGSCVFYLFKKDTWQNIMERKTHQHTINSELNFYILSSRKIWIFVDINTNLTSTPVKGSLLTLQPKNNPRLAKLPIVSASRVFY